MTKTVGGSATATARGQAGISGVDETKMPASDLIETTGSAKEYERFLPKAIMVAVPLPFLRADGARVFHNVTAGVSAVLSGEDRLREKFNTLELEELRTLPDIAKGLLYSTSLVNRLKGSNGATQSKIARASVLRSLLLSNADALARADLLPMREVERIRGGRGPYDIATDCVDLATLFRENAAILSGKTCVTVSQITETSDIGTQLQTLIRPKGTPAAQEKPEVKDAIDVRDRFWTLLVHGHENLWRAGAFLFGSRVNEHVPALLSFTRSRNRKSAEAGTEAAPETPASPQ